MGSRSPTVNNTVEYLEVTNNVVMFVGIFQVSHWVNHRQTLHKYHDRCFDLHLLQGQEFLREKLHALRLKMKHKSSKNRGGVLINILIFDDSNGYLYC